MTTLVLPSRPNLEVLLDFDPETGLFTWKERALSLFPKPEKGKSWNKQFAGKSAFTVENGNGYLCGYINYKKFYAHRVAWKIVFDEEPLQIDHINGARSDNRIVNLRAASNATNSKNKRPRANNTSGMVGVSWYKAGSKWAAQIGLDGKVIPLGHFDTFEEAKAARQGAERLYGFHPNHGQKGP